MLISRTAYRFAKSIIQLAIERNELEIVIEDLSLVDKICSENRDLAVMLKSPVIKADKKRKIFAKIFDAHFSKMTVTFFDIVFRKGREELVIEICKSFINQYKEFNKIHIITLETARPLSDDNREHVMSFLKTRINEGIELVEKVNEDLIGGIILRMNDLQIDASVRNSLNKLEKEFSKDFYSAKI